jgi:hypothetical protein
MANIKVKLTIEPYLMMLLAIGSSTLKIVDDKYIARLLRLRSRELASLLLSEQFS